MPAVLPRFETPSDCDSVRPMIEIVAEPAFLLWERVMLLPPTNSTWLLTVPVVPAEFPAVETPAMKVVAPALTPPMTVMFPPPEERVMLAPATSWAEAFGYS